MNLLSVPKLAMLGLGLAGVLRVAVDLIPMTADAGPAAGSEPVRMAVAATPPAPVASTPDDNGICEPPPPAIASAIADERALLETQRTEIADREARIALAEESLKAERNRLAGVRDEINVQLDRIEEANKQDMTKLVELYRNMKPQIAAGIMDEIDIGTAVLVISAMSERDAAQILGALSLVRARAITRIILERSKLPADRDLDGLRLR